MEKRELVDYISRRTNVGADQVEGAINEVIAELISPQIFRRPGEEVGFINDNHCTNNCKEEFFALKKARMIGK